MSPFEAQMWIAGGFFAGALVIGGIGAGLDERRQAEAQAAVLTVAMALFGISAVMAGKALLGLVIN